MTKLNSAQIRRQEEIAQSLSRKRSLLETAIEQLNDAIEIEWSAVVSALQDYNTVIDEANNFTNEIANQIEDNINGHSDKWQESEKGLACLAWLEGWRETLGHAEIDKPESVELDVEDGSTIDNLPQEAEL